MVTYTPVGRDTLALRGRYGWPVAAGSLIATGGVLLTAATAIEVWVGVASSATAAVAFWSFFVVSTIAHVAAMFPLALGAGDGRGAAGSSVIGKVALLGFGAVLLTNQSTYLLRAYLLPEAAPLAPGGAAFLLSLGVAQSLLLVAGGFAIARARVLRGSARWAVLVLAAVALLLGVTITVSTDLDVVTTAYFASTISQIVAGILIARAAVSAQAK
ncbi:hypothetical protein [Microbacterium radiodurans]|uniref:Uncharacterized protein n=1 Tax=Microbacterium radiodurans TaxID=661398 RepID=A0A5J5IXB2_9MICO|nr:hypothetical protein [Microbacterium radiodurans]KAA9089432.1 hypothetical protein F6B42_02810 [Microbacterium radiodurans]